MANVYFVNFALTAANDIYSGIWKLSRAMKKAGWTYKSSSDGSAIKDTTGVAANDTWGGNADPALDTIPAFGNLPAWWNAQGPSTLKIPIGTASTGTFIRGEDISQATTGAHGELVSYLWDIPTSQGYLVVAPRVDGSGGDPHGWDHTHIITGGISGATITPNATVIEFVREIVFAKGTDRLTGNIFYQCVDNNAENSSRFSNLAPNATFTNAPGSGTTSNLFPTPGSFTLVGVGNTPGTFTNRWVNQIPTGSPTKAHCVATNNVYSSGVSADGSFYYAVGVPGVDAGTYVGFLFTIVDNTEPGDVDPYVFYVQSNDNAYSQTRIAALSTASLNVSFAANTGGTSTIGQTIYRFWRNRGRGGAGDTFCSANGALLAIGQGGGSTYLLALNSTDRETVANSFLTTYVSEDMWVISYNLQQRVRKGTLRWMRAVCTGGNVAATDTYGNKSWVQLASAAVGSPQIPFIVGPWDGTTVPSNA